MTDRSAHGGRMDALVRAGTDFEISIAALRARSERRAWRVAITACAVSLLLACGILALVPLKQAVPYLVMADASTGTGTLARLTDDESLHRVTSSDAINRSNVAHFVLARESYDLALLDFGDWAAVQTMAAPAVKAAYTALYTPSNPDSLVRAYGRDTAIRVRLLSIVLVGARDGGAPRGATVRLQRNLYDKTSGTTRPLDGKIATLEFAYRPGLAMDERSRIANPLGFQVTAYRVDNDYATAPPEIPAPPASVAPPVRAPADAAARP